jgi:hypothetical protein
MRALLTSRVAVRAVIAALLGLALPGAGHVFLGRWGRGLTFMAALVSLFALGIGMHARLSFYWGLDDVLSVVISIGQVAMGLPYWLARSLGIAAGQVTAPTFDYGLTFTGSAGLLNLLVALDAFDTARGARP